MFEYECVCFKSVLFCMQVYIQSIFAIRRITNSLPLQRQGMINIIIYGCLEQQETLLKAWINFSQTNRIIKASSQFSNNWMTGCLGVWVRGIRARAHVCIHVSLKLLMPVEGCQLCDAGRGTGRVPCPDSISFHLRTPANM